MIFKKSVTCSRFYRPAEATYIKRRGSVRQMRGEYVGSYVVDVDEWSCEKDGKSSVYPGFS